MDKVVLSADADLAAIFKEIEKYSQKIRRVADDQQKLGKQTDEVMKKTTKNTETMFTKVNGFGRRVLNQLTSDMKALMSIQALTGGMKLSEQFRGSIKETVALSDQIRKLGTTLGIASKDFSSFQSKMTKGLGDIGLSSEAASRALEGLSETQVRGQENLIEYSKLAGQLASVGRQQGSEGEIAKGLAGVVQSRGGNVNDINQVRAISQELLKVQNATGQKMTESIQFMQDVFSKMPMEVRKQVSTPMLTGMAAGEAVAGKGSTAFIQDLLSQGQYGAGRLRMQAQGINLMGDKGISVEGLKKLREEAIKMGGGDLRQGVQNITGASDEAAEGLVRLIENMDRLQSAQDNISKSTADLNTQYRQSMGLGESFRASINKVKGLFATPMSWMSQKATDVMGKASESNTGAVLATGGAAIAAAVLAGGGLRGLGKGLGLGGLAKAEGIEAITGEHVQKVYVVNASEMGGGIAGAAGGMGMLGKAGLVGAAGAGGYALGSAVANPIIDKYTQGTTAEGFQGNAMERLFFKLDKLFGGEASSKIMQAQKVVVQVETQDPKLKASAVKSRGAVQ